ncbi:hypothetical protein MOC55_11950 [Bacillus spizizenii]|uniref:Uncharacterized protein n=1 Tax=Bacillus spizizenii TaxID=96241 RepID=A0A9Q4H8Q3_BACSC|nr:hypothetical protein [Bacillus spizizenii]MCY8155180.1 hypothetical protein [Bacillus spizizenii]MCY8196551.1 hypothetical protein [Bacillus spizizenii]MCY8219321.1 hypothetical protein [Bacillus spizizenii]MCY8313000.1 hypothetical protein [Bacillus spizizenii]
MLKNNDQNTEVTYLPNGWVHLAHIDAYWVYLKTFIHEGQPLTIYMDDFSVEPISVKAYHLDDLVIDEDWANLHENTILSCDTMDVEFFKPHLPAHIYKELKKAHNEFFED